jgi:hypothetical protein
LIHIICPAMMTNTERLTMSLRRHPDEGIVQPDNWPPAGSIWIRRLKHQKTRGNSSKSHWLPLWPDED